jgi:hypothetical protein
VTQTQKVISPEALADGFRQLAAAEPHQQNPIGLHAKMVAARRDVGVVSKRGENTKQGYKYVKAADVAAEVREALAKHGIDFDYSLESERTWETPTASGGKLFLCSLIVVATFTDVETGNSKSVRGIGWGADSLEKAPYKAMTGALKYILRMNFLIPDEEDPEKDNKLYEELEKEPDTIALGGRIDEAAFDSKLESRLWLRVAGQASEYTMFCDDEKFTSKLAAAVGQVWTFDCIQQEPTKAGKTFYLITYAAIKPEGKGKK